MTTIGRRRTSRPSSSSTTIPVVGTWSFLLLLLVVLLFGVTPVVTTTTTTTTTSIINDKDDIEQQHDHLRRVGPTPNSTTSLVEEEAIDDTFSIFSSSPLEADSTHLHLRSTFSAADDSSFHKNDIVASRQLQNTCNIQCSSDVQCCSNSGGCNCCQITNNIAGTGICTNEFGCGRDSQCWDGPNTCVGNYVELQSAFKLVNPGQTIKLCQNSLIQLRNGQSLMCHKSHIKVECESGNNCRIQRISGTGRLMIFSGTDITLQRLTLIGGSSSQGGGGALFVQGTANIQGLKFQTNQVSSGGGRGGAANIGSGSSRPAFSGSGNTAVAGCNGIFVRPNGPCYGVPVSTQDRFNSNRIQGNTQCGNTCFSNGNCNREGLEGYCRMCDLEQSSATFGTCIINPNDDPRTFDQCSTSCTTDGDCSIQVGPCNTCEANKCIDSSTRVIVPSPRTCVNTQEMLRTALNSPTEQVVEICANTNIVLTSEIVSTQPNKILRCQEDRSNGCYITRERGNSYNTSRLLTLGNNVSVRHITFQNGNANQGAGGAINFMGPKVEVSHCNFIGNTAKTGGAIALMSLSSQTILQSNFGAGNGGGGCMNIVVKSTGQCLNF